MNDLSLIFVCLLIAQPLTLLLVFTLLLFTSNNAKKCNTTVALQLIEQLAAVNKTTAQ